jgi:general secretion pathway protein N
VAAIGRIEPAKPPPPQVTPEPPRPSLTLIGAVIGETDAIAIFLDQTRQGIVRLRTGEDHEGWVLSSVVGREATLQRGSQREVFALPSPQGEDGRSTPGAASLPRAAPMPVVAAPSTSSGVSFAPFIPRSTPKNGESDGL